MADRLLSMAERNPAAAQEQAKKWGIPWKTLGAGALAGAWAAGNHYFPDTIATPGELIDKGINKITTIGADPSKGGPPTNVQRYTPPPLSDTSDSPAPAAAPAAAPAKNSTADTSSADTNSDDFRNDPAYKEALRKALAGEHIDESTKQLNRMVYLSRL